MTSKLISGFGFLAGIIAWATGAWQVYEANTLLGAVLVLLGGLLIVLAVAWRRRDPEAGFNGFLAGILEFISRAHYDPRWRSRRADPPGCDASGALRAREGGRGEHVPRGESPGR
jgi:hypothetical protein